MLRSIVGAGLVCASLGLSTVAVSGIVDPECTAKKAGKSAAMKATVGVGGRCDMTEAANDTAKRAVDADGKSAHGERHHDEAGVVKKSAKATKNLVTD